MKKGFAYCADTDTFICEQAKQLRFTKITYKKTNQNYYRIYSLPSKECKDCQHIKRCAVDHGAIRINASGFYPAYYANRQRFKTPKYKVMKQLRSIWSEGTFAALKNQHNLKRAKKRGIHRVSEECLLSALALNLKRMVRAFYLWFRSSVLIPNSALS